MRHAIRCVARAGNNARRVAQGGGTRRNDQTRWFEPQRDEFELALVPLPYFLAMANDLKSCGYKRLDIFRVYGLNLVLLPVVVAIYMPLIYYTDRYMYRRAQRRRADR